MNWMTADLADLTDRRAGRAAVVLVLVHLLVALVAWLLWGLGHFFVHVRWLPIALVFTYAALGTIGVMVRFGYWPMGVVRGFGEVYTETFSPVAGAFLGMLRLLMQFFLIFVLIPVLVMTWFNMRWWHVVGTDELDALPALAATIPVSQEWEHQPELDRQSETGFLAFMDPPISSAGPAPEGYVLRTYDVPKSYTYQDLEQWMSGPAWEDPESFGPTSNAVCEDDNTCRVRLLPSDGQEPEYVVETHYSGGTFPSVTVRLEYSARATG